MSRVLSTALLALVLAAAHVSALTTKVVAGHEDCFHEFAAPGVTLNVGFAVTHGGKLDVDARVKVWYWSDATLRVHEEELKSFTLASEGHAEYVAPTNNEQKPLKMEICISNKMARWTPKWVNIEFYKLLPTSDDGLSGDHNRDFRTFEDQLHGFSSTMYEMRMKMQKLKQMEEEHRNTVESTNSWIFYGAFVNGGLLAAMAIFQFVYLKDFLSVRSAILRA